MTRTAANRFAVTVSSAVWKRLSSTYDAIRLRYNAQMSDGEGSWQSLLLTLDVKTNDAGLFLSADGRLAVVDRMEKFSTKATCLATKCAIMYTSRRTLPQQPDAGYLPDGAAEQALSNMGCVTYISGGLPANHAETDACWMTYRPATQEKPSGTVEFYCKEAWLDPRRTGRTGGE